ncbi:MAG TPA: 4a-hydroxytetrahydrobiopterin dehydratase, partial [Propionibacteriaceae bacterium]
MTKLTGQQIADAGLDGWANLVGGLQTRIWTRDFATGLTIVAAIGAAAEDMDHHPDLDLRYGHVDVRLSSHDERGVTGRDVRLARKIAAITAAADVELDSVSVSRLELALDSPAHRAVLPFWAAVLGMQDQASAGVHDEVR